MDISVYISLMEANLTELSLFIKIMLELDLWDGMRKKKFL